MFSLKPETPATGLIKAQRAEIIQPRIQILSPHTKADAILD